jgi:hypothetical protein
MKYNEQCVDVQLFFDLSHVLTICGIKALFRPYGLFSFMKQSKSLDENGNAVHQNYRLESTNSNDRKSKLRRMKVYPYKIDTTVKLTSLVLL